MGFAQQKEVFQYLIEPSLEERAEIWFGYCDRIARRMRDAGLGLSQTIEECRRMRRKFVNSQGDFHCYSQRDHWCAYEEMVRKQMKDLVSGESVLRGVVILDMLFSDLSHLLAARQGSTVRESMRDADELVRVNVAGGSGLVVREIDVAAGLVRRENLECVGKIGNIQIVADAEIPRGVVDTWLTENEAILEKLRGVSAEDGGSWRRGMDGVRSIYLTGKYDSWYAYLPVPGNDGDLMIMGIKRWVASAVLGGELNLSDSVWREGIYVHEFNHFGYMGENPVVRSGTIMEVLADLDRVAYFSYIGHGKYVARMEAKLGLMFACLKGKRSLVDFPENEVIGKMLIGVMDNAAWERVFETLGITITWRHKSRLG